jgi:hypothetical protein
MVASLVTRPHVKVGNQGCFPDSVTPPGFPPVAYRPDPLGIRRGAVPDAVHSADQNATVSSGCQSLGRQRAGTLARALHLAEPIVVWHRHH